MPRIHLHRLTKTFPNGHAAVRGLDLEVEDGELMVLVGPSGSGKSTVLRMIAGLEAPTSGRIEIGGREVTRLPPRERDVAMVFQSYALYPHMTVRENLGFGLRMRGVARTERERRVTEVAGALGLGALLERRPAQLSGGQRQRVALGRAIAREPAAFLFDEPLSNLDARLRVETRAELARLHRRLGTTAVYVTHDQTEAMTLGRRVAVLHGGELQQVAPPMRLFRDPANRFVGGFIGSPGMNFLRGSVERADGAAGFRTGAGEVPLDPARLGEAAGEAWLGVRPHRLRVEPGGEGEGLAARVAVVEPLGSEQVVRLETADGQPLAAAVPPDLALRPDDAVRLRVPPHAVHLFRPSDGRRVSPDLAAS